MKLLQRLWAWLWALFRPKPPLPSVLPKMTRSLVPLLIYPKGIEQEPVGEEVRVGEALYFLSWPVELPRERVEAAIDSAKSWLDDVLGTELPWAPLERLDSKFTLSQWRSSGIELLKREIKDRSMPWYRDQVYLAFVRGMGGYAGGTRYQESTAGYAMVGDVCLEAICGLPEPNAASALLGEAWSDTSRSAQGQTAAFIHETLHGLDLPHPDGWPADEQPAWGETIMGYWWNMPNFLGTRGLTEREIQRALRWLG